MRKLYLFVMCAILLFCFSCQTKRNFFKFDESSIDSLYFIKIEYFSSPGHPYFLASLLPKDDECILDLTNLDSIKSSLQLGSHITKMDVYYLPIFEMVNIGFADSTETFKGDMVKHNVEKVYKYFIKTKNIPDQRYVTTDNVNIYIEVLLVSGITYQDENSIGVAAIKDITKMSVNENFADEHYVIISKKTLYPSKKPHQKNRY